MLGRETCRAYPFNTAQHSVQQLSWMSRELLCFKREDANWLGSSATERMLVAHHGIQNGKELSHTSGESYFLEFPAFQ